MATGCVSRRGVLTRDRELSAQVHGDVGVKPHFSLEAFDDLEEDVRQSINRLKGSPFIPRKDRIRGFIYDVKSGRLQEVK